MHMKSHNFTEVPPVPVVVQSVVPCCRAHFSNAWGQLVCTCPCRLNVFTRRSSSPFHVAQVEVVAALRTMAIDMPTWNCYVDLSCIGDSHRFWEAGHAFPKVFQPLAYDVVRDNDSQEGKAYESREN